ncbi:MAG: hypothetical protein FJW38_14230 [Acidobacteria bacterium]|nr:hypothetical protein [Acidobacteriota bacterium]
MFTWAGRYCENTGTPILRVTVSGNALEHAIEVDAIIDTGFAGFVLMPIMQALPLGLTLVGVAEFTLADGRTAANYTGLGSVSIEGESRSGIFVLESNPECGNVLLGMAFLRRLDASLTVDKAGVTIASQEA